jgi:hypothetical protein
MRGTFVHIHHRVEFTMLVAVTLVLSTVGAGLATPTDDPTEAAAGWLTTQLTDGERLTVQFGEDVFDSHGPTADVLLALASAGVASGVIDDIAAWFDQESTVAAYTGDGVDEVYAGATSKLLVVVATVNGDPGAFGDRDLVAQLVGLRQPDGRFSDTSAFGDFSSTLTQAFAVIGLHRTAPGGLAPEDVQFLLDQQCEDGGFRFSPDAEDCVSNVDTTGMVVQALVAVGGQDTAVADAITWLLDVQEDHGGFAGGDEPANANSTSLAALALTLAGQDDAAAEARAFILSLQRSCDDEERGAIQSMPNDAGDLALATAQSVWGLVGVSLAEVSADGASSDVPMLDCPEPVADATPEPTDEPTEDFGEPEEETLPATGSQGVLLLALALGIVALGATVVRSAPRAHRS